MDNLATNKRYDTLSDALSILDPKGTLSPGTPGHNKVTELILSWMAEMESDDVLSASYDWRRVLYMEGHSWLKNWI
jgi:hypothetical protein